MGIFSGLTHGLDNIFADPSAETHIGSVLNRMTGVDSQMDKSYNQQMATMLYQNSYNTAMWNKQNEYNSPASQLARMREAGIDINPTSYALGTGNLSNTSALVGSANGFSGSGSPAGNPISALMGVAQGIQGMKESGARINNIHAQNGNIKALTDVNIAQADYLSAQADRMNNDNDFFVKHGYYPTHADTPVGSAYETGLVGDLLGAMFRGMKNYEIRTGRKI